MIHIHQDITPVVSLPPELTYQVRCPLFRFPILTHIKFLGHRNTMVSLWMWCMRASRGSGMSTQSTNGSRVVHGLKLMPLSLWWEVKRAHNSWTSTASGGSHATVHSLRGGTTGHLDAVKNGACTSLRGPWRGQLHTSVSTTITTGLISVPSMSPVSDGELLELASIY